MGRIKLGKFVANRKGVSSLFIMIYVSLIAVVLISTLFVGLSLSDAGLTSYLRVEQARNQENILISGPGGIIVNPANGLVESIRVNNTGALTARIRAIYIEGKLVCDPSTFSGDSYIASQDSLLIPLTSVTPRISLNATTLNGQWTVTTERGTKSSETGVNLWLGPSDGSSDPNKFYFGPLLLIFNMFHWSNDGGVTWNEGWSIPSSNNRVVWRVLLANIDERQIILDSTSSFALIQNSMQSNKIITWNLPPNSLNPTGLTLDPGEYYFLHFSSSTPKQLGDLKVPIPVTSNFITLVGNFVEQDGRLTQFGQTIPFEAVIIT